MSSVQYQVPYMSSTAALASSAGPSNMANSPHHHFQQGVPQQQQLHPHQYAAHQQSRPSSQPQTAQPNQYNLGYTYPQPGPPQIPSQNPMQTPQMNHSTIPPVRPHASAQPRHASQTPTLANRQTPLPNGTARNGSTHSSIPSGSRVPSPSNESERQPEASGSQPVDKPNDAADQSGPTRMAPAPPTFPYFGQHPSLPTLLAPGQSSTFLPPGGSGLPYSGTGLGIGFENGGYFAGPNDWLDHEGNNSHPLYQAGAAIDAMHHFVACFDNMTGGTHEEWTKFVEEQFEEESRMKISLVSSKQPGLKLFDVQSTLLPRIFTSFNPHLVSSTLHLRHNSETPLWSPPSSPTTDLPPNALPRHGIKLDSEGEWRMLYQGSAREVVLKVSVVSTWVAAMEEGVLKLETLEINVEDWTGDETMIGEWGLPDRVVQYFQICQSMEDVMGVIELHDQGLSPTDALTAMTLPPPAKAASPVNTPANEAGATADGSGAEKRQDGDDEAMDQSS